LTRKAKVNTQNTFSFPETRRNENQIKAREKEQKRLKQINDDKTVVIKRELKHGEELAS
jgi:hypothetical protein